MRGLQNMGMRPKRLSYAVSLALASIMAGNGAYAQQAAPSAPAAEDEITKVMVVGARASQQSAIDRKKNANTAMDSIIAEDVGAFPDRNVGEAISRISGIALDRGDYGEGVNVSVRGNGPDLTRVEIDGQGVQSGGPDLNGRGDGRGVELRELSSDLIKSVDVVKGSTAEMTEGSLGGGIIIKTRTGLDFKKRFFSVKAIAAQNSINKDISPDLNLIFADKFLDNRLGIVVNLNKSRAKNESHNVSQGGSSDRAGKVRLLDFDNSPEKTFTYDPAFLSATDAASDTRIPVTNVPDSINSFAGTPREILTKSGAAQTKADCYAAFPALTTAQAATIPTTGAARNNAINQRSNELISCLNQWNDYTPNSIRYMVKQQDDQRDSGDVRFDFKVSNNFSVYAKGSSSRREVIDTYNLFSMGGLAVNPGNVVTRNGAVPSAVDAAGVRTATPGINYYTFPTTTSYVGNVGTVRGAVANVLPGSVTVDENHHLTKYTLTNGGAGIDVALGKIKTGSDYLQTGGTYRNGGLKIEYLLGDAKSKLTRIDKRVSGISQLYGNATVTALPNGLYSYELPDGADFDQRDYDSYVRLGSQANSNATTPRFEVPNGIPAYTAAQKPLVTPTLNLALQNARTTETGERTGKIDLSYTPQNEAFAWVSVLKAGVNRRDTRHDSWLNGGFTMQDAVGTWGAANYEPGIYVPTQNLRSSVIGCQDTPGSLAAGGQKCAYGWNPNTDPRNPRSGQMVLTPDQYKDVLAQSLVLGPNAQFYAGAKDRPAEMIDGWQTLDVEKFYSAANIPNFNLDCIKECVGSDGKTYSQATESFREKTTSGYLMAEFDFEKLPFTSVSLPFGMSIAGNVGYRYVKVNVQGSGFQTFQSIRKVQGTYDELNPNAPGGTTTTTFRKATTIQSNTTDFMPIYNLALWAIPDTLVLRYNHAKTIARPSMFKLLPSGTCIYDERIADADDGDSTAAAQRCTGTMGNPGLQPFTNSNRNLSLEWYVNKDTMFTAAIYKQKGIIGAGNLSVPQVGGNPFADSNAVDPGTGIALKDLSFNFNQWENLPASTRKGFEVGTKTAFTFLPSYLRYTGLDANYTRNKSAVSSVNYRDLLTGSALPVPDEPAYSYNASLWYDDGAFTARVALQARAPMFRCIAPCSGTAVNNFPADGAVNWRVPYNPGSPIFTNATRFIDAKMAYRFKNGVEIFAEARNLNRSRTTSSTGGYADFASGAPNILSDMYYGARYTVGVVYRTM